MHSCTNYINNVYELLFNINLEGALIFVAAKSIILRYKKGCKLLSDSSLVRQGSELICNDKQAVTQICILPVCIIL